MKDSKSHFTNDKDLRRKENVSIPTNEENKNFFELTTPQKNIWDMDQFYGNTPLNNVCGSVIIHEKVNFDKLKIAVDVVVKMNDSFGIEFVNDNNTVKQIYNKNIISNTSTEIIEVADKNELNNLEKKLSQIVFSKNNLFELKVFKLPNNEGGVICAIHHSLSDSWSLGLISKYIVEVYHDLLQLKSMSNKTSIAKNNTSEKNNLSTDVLKETFNIDSFVNEEKKKFKIASYFDFIEKENKYLNSSSFIKDRNYWDNIFSTVPDIPEFVPTVDSISNSKLPTASRETFELSTEMLKKISKFCTVNNTSVYNFLIAVYSIYISAISNSNDFVIGTPILNRRTVAEKSTIGMFVSTMPLRINVDNESSFNDFCRQISTNTFSAFRHQHYPYENILNDLRKKHKDLSNLFNVLISYQITKTISDNVKSESYWTFNGYSQYDLQIHILDLNDTGKLSFAYDYRDKYDKNSIRELHCRIMHIIDTVLNNCEICLKNVDIVTPDERDTILNKFNNTKVNYDKTKTLSVMFEEQVNKTPNNIAVVFEDQELTFKELNEKSNSLAYYLRNQNIKRDDVVGVMCNRSLEMIIAILAVIKSGAAYTPIDPTYPEDRINYMLDTTDAKLLLTQKVLENKVEFKNKLFVDLDNNSNEYFKNNISSNKEDLKNDTHTNNKDLKSVYDLPNENLKNINEPEDLFYVIFTSGSTGRPKGVMMKHQALSNFANYCNNYVEYLKKPKYRAFLSITTVSFDLFVYEVFISLQKGIKIILANENEKTSPTLLNKLIEKHNVTIMQSTPSVIQTFINNISEMPLLKDIEYLTMAGEQLPINLVHALHNLSNSNNSIKNKNEDKRNLSNNSNSKLTIYNGYGPSETNYVTLYKMDDNLITIGKPFYNTQMYILNNNLKPIPVGMTGEIYIAGEGVARGYIHNEELTKKSFIKNPFANNFATNNENSLENDTNNVVKSNKRSSKNNIDKTNLKIEENKFDNSIMYKTGDLGTYLPDGRIICSGRADHQVKIRGQRVELGEIETQIDILPNIKTCVVCKKVDEDSHEFLCAYYTSDEKIDISIIKGHLQAHLPRYMVPQYYIQLPVLPYTPNGKIDRKALPMPILEHIEENIVAPETDTEIKLLELFKDITHINNISTNASFFDIGGDSLSAINLSARIQSEFNVQLFVRDILEKPSIKELANFIDTALVENNNEILHEPDSNENTSIDAEDSEHYKDFSGKNRYSKQVISPVEKSDYYKVSSAQKRIYFASQIDSNSIVYNIAGSVILDGKIDVEKLKNAFTTVIQRHETLRTYFELHDTEVVQKIADDINFNLEVEKSTDFKNLDNILTDFVKPFDLSKAPLFRAKLVNFDNDKSALVIDTHHTICDGTSITVFVDELCKLYNGVTLKELDITYKDFANYEHNQVVSGALEDAENYWLDKFKGEIPVLNMPTVYQRPATQSFEGKKVYSEINSDTVLKINSAARELHITPYMLMLGAFYVLLSKYTSQNDIVVGSPVVGRDVASTYNLIGMFINTLALREKIDNSLSFKSFVLSLKDDLLNAYKYQTYPFDILVDKLDIKRDLARSPLFDFMFIYQNNGFKKFDFDGVSSKYYVPDNNTSKYDLTLEAIPEDGNIKLNFEYCSQLFNKDFVKSFASYYLNILNNILDNVDIQISNISLMSDEQQSTLLDKLNDTSLDYPKDKYIIDLFEEQARKTPDSIAIVFGNESYTYRELADKVTALANHIRELPIYKKIAKDDVKAIGIMLNRRAEVLISMFAILKAGCGYLPIDPTYPEERVSYIIENSDIKLILTEKSLSTKFVNPRSKTTKFDGFAIDTVFVDDENSYTYDKKDVSDSNVNNSTSKTNASVEINQTHNDLAYLIYTSGSTGNPKGVMIRQDNVVNFIYGMRKILPLENKSIVSITTMCFDIFVLESLVPLCSGLKVVLASNDEQNSPILLNELCKKNNVDIIQTTPSKFNFLISDESNLDYVKNMKVILLGGEPFPLNLLNKLKKLTDARIFNMYGPTETTVWSTVKELTDAKNITIGTPIANTQVYILDNDLNILPKNVPGKLFIGGDGVTAGYLHREELTLEKFVDFRGSKIYDTGDLAKINSTGELECLGRTDFQVKVRGLRIELGEIEKQISSYQGVTDAVVVVKNINDRDVLCGYFVSTGRVSLSLLRSKLSKKLPTYMVPTYFVQLQKFEHTPNGKIDRKKLPDPQITKKELVSPKTALQRRILLIWKNILSIDEISIDDNFFEIGGDSLCALKLQLELMKININVEYGDIFKNNTIESLAEFVENMENKKPEGPKYHSINFLKSNMALWKNSDKFNLKLEQKEIKNVLLIGATGYLGIHVLAELLKIDNIKIYCLIRNDPSTSAENKLKNKFKYYFGSDLSNLFGSRIIVVPGEITEEYFGLSDNMYKTIASSVYTVINCAALVKHFGKYEDFEKINVTGVKNIVTFCEKYGKTLFHTSTISVAGAGLMNLASGFNPTKKIYYGENRLYVKQSLNNVYIRSKFEAEKFILEELANKKLRGIILRIGNVTNRFVDGKFQENASENAFHNRLKAFTYLKMIPKSVYDGYVEFSPVDSIAQSIIQTMKFYTPPMSVLHLFNSKHLYIKNLLVMLKDLGVKIDVVDDDVFKDSLKNILFNSPNYDKVSVLLNDIDNDFNLLYKTNLIITNKFTLKFLNIAGFDWPEITKDYIKKIFDNL